MREPVGQERDDSAPLKAALHYNDPIVRTSTTLCQKQFISG